MGCGWILLLFFSTLSLIKCNHRSMCYWFCNCFLNGLGPKTAALVRMSFGLYIWANGWCIFLLGKHSNISVKDDLSQKAWLAMLCKVTWQRSFTYASFVEFISDAFVAHCKEMRPKVWVFPCIFYGYCIWGGVCGFDASKTWQNFQNRQIASGCSLSII